MLSQEKWLNKWVNKYTPEIKANFNNIIRCSDKKSFSPLSKIVLKKIIEYFIYQEYDKNPKKIGQLFPNGIDIEPIIDYCHAMQKFTLGLYCKVWRREKDYLIRDVYNFYIIKGYI